MQKLKDKHFAEYSPIYSGSRKERLTQKRESKSEFKIFFKAGSSFTAGSHI